MNIIKKNWLLIIILILFCIIEYFIPLNINSLYFHNLDINYYINNYTSITNGNILAELIIIITSKFKYIRIIFYSIISIYIFIYMMKIVCKKNITYIFISMFLFFLIDYEILKSGFYSVDGFIYNILSCLFMLIILYLIISNKINTTNKLKLFMLGLFGSLINPVYTILISLISVIFIIKNIVKKSDFTRYFVIFAGSLISSFIYIVLHFLNNDFYVIPNYILNFIEYTIPLLYRNNFLLSLIMIVILFYLGYKIYNRDLTKRVYIILCFISIIIYSIVYLFEFNIYFKYFAYIIYLASSYYILYNFNYSLTFKRKINLYYLFKILYILIINIFNSINISCLLFIYIIDILIILECICYLFYDDFMKKTWIIFSIVMLVVNVYLTIDSYNKYNEMNSYIYNNLECNNYIIDLPYKYKFIGFIDYIPCNLIEKENYLKYFNINISSDFYIKNKSID